VRCATTANITLSGLQTIDGTTVVAGDRVLVKNQTTGADNGIYEASATAWSRSADFDGARDAVTGTIGYVRSGTANGDQFFKLTTTGDITIGTTSLTFTVVNGPGLATVSSFVSALLDDTTLDAFLTTLGVSSAMRTLIEAASAAAARTALSAAATTTTISAGGLLTGGGDLSASRTITFAATAHRNYIAGLLLSRNSGTPNTKIDIATGVAMDDTNAAIMTTSGATTIDAGTTGANGLDTGSLANSTWYHVFLIGKVDGTVAGFMSTSTGPTLPTGYVYKRELGQVKTDGSAHFLAFLHEPDGETFLWSTPPTLDIDVASVPNTAVSRTLSNVPSGVRVKAILNALAKNAANNYVVYFSSLDTTDVAASVTATPLGQLSTDSGGATVLNSTTRVEVWTDTSQAIRTRQSTAGGATDLFKIAVIGWRFPRGSNA
jgi:hypothetical protein